MRMSDLGAAIVGTGFMGWVHVEALRRVGVQVVGVLGSSAAKSRQAAEHLGVPRAYASFDEVLADDSVDAIHIVTPNRLHYKMALGAMSAEKHVMCEKPLAMNSAESGHLMQRAHANPHLAAAVNYNLRFYPLCVEARQRIHQGDLGDVFHVSGSYVQDWLLRDTDFNWRVLAEEVGELRAIADIGTHWLDLIHTLTSADIESVCADLHTVHPTRARPTDEVQTFAKVQSKETEEIPITTDDYGSVLLRFSDGARGNFFVSQVMAGRKNCLRFEIAGSKRSIAWNSELPNELWIGQRDRANSSLIRDPALLCDAARKTASYPGGHNEGYADSFKQCFKAFYSAILSGAPNDLNGAPNEAALFPTFADGHREVRLCEAILESHQKRQWVEVHGE